MLIIMVVHDNTDVLMTAAGPGEGERADDQAQGIRERTNSRDGEEQGLV